MDRAVYEELPNDILVAECLEEPYCKLDILLKCLSDELDVSWNRRSALGSYCYCEHKAYLKLQYFELITAVAAAEQGRLK